MTEPCPQRHLHASYVTPMMQAAGWVLLPCLCGLTYAKRIERERN
jgi:hypothetical protein